MPRKNRPQGTHNVLTDVGLDDAEELSAKALLAVKLNDLIDQRGLSQVETARLTGMTQLKVSQVRRYRLQNISLERLMQALVSLDQRVEIVVRPARRAAGAGITVAGLLAGRSSWSSPSTFSRCGIGLIAREFAWNGLSER